MEVSYQLPQTYTRDWSHGVWGSQENDVARGSVHHLAGRFAGRCGQAAHCSLAYLLLRKKKRARKKRNRKIKSISSIPTSVVISMRKYTPLSACWEWRHREGLVPATSIESPNARPYRPGQLTPSYECGPSPLSMKLTCFIVGEMKQDALLHVNLGRTYFQGVSFVSRRSFSVN